MQAQSSTAFEDLVRSYRAQCGTGASGDEMLAADGSVRPVWMEFVQHFSSLGPEDRAQRFSRGDQYLRDAGVLYRQYDETVSSEREWPLSHIPVILSEAEWQTISEGLIERAELLEEVLRDFYGDNDLVRSGQLPATLLAANPAWLRPMLGMGQGGGPLLNSLSFEIGRGPDGKWWVISDLVEAPSTAGFAIENRIAMTRTFPNFFNSANIHRLAGFFTDVQQRLLELKGRSEGEIALLTPGPLNQNYPEHAYLARYLGLLLVEGEDLIVQDGKAMVRTVAGMTPVSLLWSRLPSGMFDPLELNPASMLGAPGLVQALRDTALKTVNLVGAGVLETRALMAFLPKIARARLGRGLKLSNIATWWCGQEAQRAHVFANKDRMMIGNAFSTTPLMADPATVALGSTTPEAFAAIEADIARTAGRNLVGQEAVTLSTTPSFENGALVSRPMCIRISLGRTAQGWTVMPGGYARISAGDDAKALAMQQGGKVADVWVTSPHPVERPKLRALEAAALTRSSAQSILPSRAADNLFWLGRYVERAEQNMRLYRGYVARLADGAAHTDALPSFMRAQLMDQTDPPPCLTKMAQSFAAPLDMGLQSAARISDRFSPDGMMMLRALVAQIKALKGRDVGPDDMTSEVSSLLRQITGFSGLVHENMYRSDGWRFMSLGVSLERAANMCSVLAACTAQDAPLGALDLALEIGDSVVAHRARFLVWANTASVVDILGLDDKNPRSVRYHVTRARDHIAHLPQPQQSGRASGDASSHTLSDVARRVLRAETTLATSDTQDIRPETLQQLKQDIWGISDALNTHHLV